MKDPILEAASMYVGTPYGHPRTRYDTEVVDCSTLTAHVLDIVYGPVTPGEWSDLVVADGERPWSPIELAHRKWGTEVPAPIAGRWHLVQGWRVLPPSARASGHAMLLWCAGPVCNVLEAQQGYGVRWRGGLTAKGPLDLQTAHPYMFSALRAEYANGCRLVVLGQVPLAPA